MDNFVSSAVTVAIAIVGVATLAVIVSRQSNTAGVIQAATSGFASDLAAAVSPITGSGLGGFSAGLPQFQLAQ